MNIYRFDNPWGLLFLLLPLLCILTVFASRYIFKKGVKFSDISKFKQQISIKIVGFYLNLIFMLTGLLLIAFSLTKPQFGIQEEKIISHGIDIIIALDTSGSMTSQDFKLNRRIDIAKKILLDFVDKRNGDRVGLVTFATSSLLRCPATLNSPILKAIIQRIDIDPYQESAGKTSIGIGLASAINRLIHLKNSEQSDSKIIILVTDGINNYGEITPETASELAKNSNIKVYTIGIGKKEEVDLELLEKIAENTQGVFFHAKTSGQLGDIFAEIDKLEKHKIETFESRRFNDIGYRFVILGSLLIILSTLLNTLFFKRLN